ncbi:unnamed protein product [Brachionus calyciflorus]|uniref:Uncharacterized protein n=1 Tax=Brachionus calyciflorus TaxID=104777 RepID=A0A814KAP8_9BILA|nr:unnamed protein product [Brachionus calyciflorus]
MVVKSFPDSCYLNTTTKLKNLITTTTSSQTTTESTESFITTETTSWITQDQTTTILNPVLTTIKTGCNDSEECIQNPIVLPNNNISILTIGCVNQICACLHPNATYVHTILACKVNKDGSCTYTEECAYGTCNGQKKCTGNDPNG